MKDEPSDRKFVQTDDGQKAQRYLDAGYRVRARDGEYRVHVGGMWRWLDDLPETPA